MGAPLKIRSCFPEMAKVRREINEYGNYYSNLTCRLTGDFITALLGDN